MSGHTLGPQVVGQRIVVRHLLLGEIGPSGGPAMTDVLGVCEAWNPGESVVIRREDGEVRTIALTLLVSGKPVPPRPSIRQRVSIRDAEARTLGLFTDQESTAWGEWLLRTQPVLTGRLVKRANSCFAFGHPGREFDDAPIESFYAARERPALVQVSENEPWEEAFRARGWLEVPGSQTAFQLTSVALLRRALPTSHHDATSPTEAAESGPVRGTTESHADTDPASGGIEKTTLTRSAARVSLALERDWLAIYGLAVDPSHRRQGLARQLMAEAVAWGAERGATTAWLHVETDNTAAIALYQSMGFRTHHLTRYLYSPRGLPAPGARVH